MAVSKEDVQQSRSRVDSLTAQIAAEKEKLNQKQAQADSSVRKISLDREAQRLEQQLSDLRRKNVEADKIIAEKQAIVNSAGTSFTNEAPKTVSAPEATKKEEGK